MDASKARALERIARQRGISFSALAREGVDALLKSPKYVRFLAAVRG